MKAFKCSFAFVALGTVYAAAIFRRQELGGCPGYTASNVQSSDSGLVADLSLAGAACNAYGTDLTDLKLEVTYETSSRLHVKIYDTAEQVYQIPEHVIPRPNGSSSSSDAVLEFSHTASPFSFAVSRKDTGEVLFDTSGANLVFESQYLGLRTSLPDSPHLYGIGESTDPFELETTNYTRTLWSRDALGTPEWTNLYERNHPIYFDHRGVNGTHGVFIMNSDGMDVKIDRTDSDGQYLEYNIIGGVFDFYFLAGPSPDEVSRQYAEVVGTPAMMPYWGWGFHQCRYGYRDVYEVAEVVANYSLANIPLEIMWTDIDYMELRRVFTLDPERYPLHLMRELVDHLHAHQQQYIVMVDPAVAHRDYPPYNRGVEDGIFLLNPNGSVYTGVVWPGPASFPDWLNPDTQNYWNSEFIMFFSPDDGVDIDGLWIDMNEASNFCIWPCLDPYAFAEEAMDPPPPPPVRPNAGRVIPGFPADFQPSGSSRMASRDLRERQSGSLLGLPGRDLLDPAYMINNTQGSLSNLTIRTDLQHATGQYLYDTHNMYGSMMSETSRHAMLNRRPGRRPLVITRSTFAGAGASVGHWLGDNFATWFHYRVSIAQMLEFSALFQVPMVGADVCGFSGYNTTVKLCQRWATLGAFYPFFRNHADLKYEGVPIAPHEFYLWPEVADTARTAINRRYQLIDYIYTAFYRQTLDGTSHLKPLFFVYPEDPETVSIEYQFFFGDAILVSPVTEDNGTSVTFYVPQDTFYDYFTWQQVPDSQTGAWNTIDNVPFSDITVHIKGGSIVPRRITSANTTTELRKKNFELIVALDSTGSASGSLYLDDGDSIEQPATSDIKFAYSGGSLSMTGTFDYDVGDVSIVKVNILGCNGENGSYGDHGDHDHHEGHDKRGGHDGWDHHPPGGHHGWPGGDWHHDCDNGASYCSFDVNLPLTGSWSGRLM